MSTSIETKRNTRAEVGYIINANKPDHSSSDIDHSKRISVNNRTPDRKLQDTAKKEPEEKLRLLGPQERLEAIKKMQVALRTIGEAPALNHLLTKLEKPLIHGGEEQNPLSSKENGHTTTVEIKLALEALKEMGTEIDRWFGGALSPSISGEAIGTVASVLTQASALHLVKDPEISELVKQLLPPPETITQLYDVITFLYHPAPGETTPRSTQTRGLPASNKRGQDAPIIKEIDPRDQTLLSMLDNLTEPIYLEILADLRLLPANIIQLVEIYQPYKPDQRYSSFHLLETAAHHLNFYKILYLIKDGYKPTLNELLFSATALRLAIVRNADSLQDQSRINNLLKILNNLISHLNSELSQNIQCQKNPSTLIRDSETYSSLHNATTTLKDPLDQMPIQFTATGTNDNTVVGILRATFPSLLVETGPNPFSIEPPKLQARYELPELTTFPALLLHSFKQIEQRVRAIEMLTSDIPLSQDETERCLLNMSRAVLLNPLLERSIFEIPEQKLSLKKLITYVLQEIDRQSILTPLQAKSRLLACYDILRLAGLDEAKSEVLVQLITSKKDTLSTGELLSFLDLLAKWEQPDPITAELFPPKKALTTTEITEKIAKAYPGQERFVGRIIDAITSRLLYNDYVRVARTPGQKNPDIRRTLDRMKLVNCIIVTGPSGSGKTHITKQIGDDIEDISPYTTKPITVTVNAPELSPAGIEGENLTELVSNQVAAAMAMKLNCNPDNIDTIADALETKQYLVIIVLDEFINRLLQSSGDNTLRELNQSLVTQLYRLLSGDEQLTIGGDKKSSEGNVRLVSCPTLTIAIGAAEQLRALLNKLSDNHNGYTEIAEKNLRGLPSLPDEFLNRALFINTDRVNPESLLSAWHDQEPYIVNMLTHYLNRLHPSNNLTILVRTKSDEVKQALLDYFNTFGLNETKLSFRALTRLREAVLDLAKKDIDSILQSIEPKYGQFEVDNDAQSTTYQISNKLITEAIKKVRDDYYGTR